MKRPPQAQLLHTHLAELRGYFPALRDGDPESVHRARVETRRLREILRLYEVTHPVQGDRLTRVVRKVGRCLGPVRELDVMQEVLDELERRVSSGTLAVPAARSALMHRRNTARRRMLRALEGLKLDRLEEKTPSSEGPWISLPGRDARRWSGALRERIGRRADRLSTAVDRATGVYVPKRAHAVRVAVKKLRYCIEVADVTGRWRPPRLLGDLKQMQEMLGRLHDTQVLLDGLDRLVPDAVPAMETAVLAGVLESDVAREYARYLDKRSRLRAICGACQRFAGPRGRRRRHWPMAASAAALPTAVVLLTASAADTGQAPRARYSTNL